MDLGFKDHDHDPFLNVIHSIHKINNFFDCSQALYGGQTKLRQILLQRDQSLK